MYFRSSKVFGIFILLYQLYCRYGIVYSFCGDDSDSSDIMSISTTYNTSSSLLTTTTTQSFSCAMATIIPTTSETLKIVSSIFNNQHCDNDGKSDQDALSVVTAYVDVTLAKTSSSIPCTRTVNPTIDSKKRSRISFLEDEDILNDTEAFSKGLSTRTKRAETVTTISTSLVTITSTTTSISTFSNLYAGMNLLPPSAPYNYNPYYYNNYYQHGYHHPQYTSYPSHNIMTFIQDEDDDAFYYTYYPSTSNTIITVTTHIGGNTTTTNSHLNITSSISIPVSLNTTAMNTSIDTAILETIGFVTRTKIIPTTTQAITYIDMPTQVTITTTVSVPTMMTLPTTQTITTAIPVTIPTGFISQGDDSYTSWKKKHRLFIQSGGTETEWRKIFLVSMAIDWRDYVQQSIREELGGMDITNIGCNCNSTDSLSNNATNTMDYKKQRAQAFKKRVKQQILQSYYQNVSSNNATGFSLYPKMPVTNASTIPTAISREKMSFTSCPLPTINNTLNETWTKNATISNSSIDSNKSIPHRAWNFYHRMRNNYNDTFELDKYYNDTVWLPSAPYDAYSLISACNSSKNSSIDRNYLSSKVDLNSTLSILKGLIDGVITISHLLQVSCMTQALRTVLILLGRYCPLCYDENGQKLYHFDFLYNDFLKGQHVVNVEVDRSILVAIYTQLLSGTSGCCPNSVVQQYYRDENGEINSPQCCV